MKLNNQILKNLLPGLIPLFIFIAAEGIWGLKVGLIVAVGFGILELIFTYIRFKRIEKFILTDTLLLLILGAVSYLLNNDIFFKLKPALIEGILAIILAVSVFSPKNIVMAMSQRYMKGMAINEAAQNQMNKNLKVLFFITIAHIGLIIYSVYYLSDEAWAFISGVLYYLIFVVYFGFEFLKNKLKAKKFPNEEWLPIVNEKGEIIGKSPRSLCHNGEEKLLHPVIHLHVFNVKKEIYLQKRALHKKIQPGKWDTAVGGHMSFGEKIEIALNREAEEEIGLADFNAQFLNKYIWESEVEKELVFMFITQTDRELLTKNNEIDDGKFWSFQEINKNLNKNIFTPNFEHEFNMLKTLQLFIPH